jgi:hypothetical protein
MNDAAFMGCGQAFRKLHAYPEDFLLWQRPGSQLLVERDSRYVLHYQEVNSSLRVEVVDGGYIWVIELRENQGLFVEVFAGWFIEQRAGRKDLDGNVAS